MNTTHIACKRSEEDWLKHGYDKDVAKLAGVSHGTVSNVERRQGRQHRKKESRGGHKKLHITECHGDQPEDDKNAEEHTPNISDRAYEDVFMDRQALSGHIPSTCYHNELPYKEQKY